MDYTSHNHIILQAKTLWHNLGWNRAFGWLIIIIILIFLFILLHTFQIPLKNDSRHASFLKLAKRRKSDNDFILKAVQKFEKKNSKMDTSNLSEDEIRDSLLLMFQKADANHDAELDVSEVANLMNEKVNDHLTAALKENFFIFTAVDQKPRNGAVSWDEYLHYFLRQNRYTDSEIEVYSLSIQGLPKSLKEKLMKDKIAFAEAAREDPERLSIDEFLSFRHPESSHSTILNYVDETMFKHDLNGDGFLTEKEFSDPELNEDGLDAHHMDKYRRERVREFREVLDKNNNGKVDRNELVHYFDPRHIHHSKKEAKTLIKMGDINDDSVLSLAEVLMHKETFVNSKLINVAKSFHEEF